MGTCAANDIVTCTGPSDCTGATPDGGHDCCAVADVANNPDGAAFPNCSITALTATCGSCKTNVQVSCSQGPEHLHVCTQKSDCASDTANPECCPVLGYSVCLNSILAGFGNLTCMK